MIALAALCGFFVVGGIALAVLSLQPVPVRTKAPSTRVRDPLLTRRLLASTAATIATLVVTRWPVAAVGAGAVGWIAAGVRGKQERLVIEQRTEAIALWSEMLRDAMGTARGIEGVLVATAATAPLPIRPELQTMARRLQAEPIAEVLDGLAADLNHPIGDLVVTALRLTSTAGGRNVRDVLNSLATAAYDEATSQRRVEVARERPRAAMTYTAMVIVGFIALLAVFSRRYLAPYNSAVGQFVLAVVLGYWAVGFWWMRRMSRPEPVERALTKPVLL
jgi:Flp pilus assembly protein TadB